MNVFSGVWDWLTDGAHWTGESGIPTRVLEHLEYTALTLLAAIIIAVPLGAWIGHIGRGAGIVGMLANSLRALPSFGVLILLTVWALDRAWGTGGLLAATVVTLLILAIPPILTNTYAGVRAVDPAVRDAARGMGMSPMTQLLRVELPNALPLIMAGIRSAYLQVVATAVIAPYISLGGLGTYVYYGLSQQDYPQMTAGAVLIALLAIAGDLLLAGVTRLIVSPGLQIPRRRAWYRRRPNVSPAAATTAAVEPASTDLDSEPNDPDTAGDDRRAAAR